MPTLIHSSILLDPLGTVHVVEGRACLEPADLGVVEGVVEQDGEGRALVAGMDLSTGKKKVRNLQRKGRKTTKRQHSKEERKKKAAREEETHKALHGPARAQLIEHQQRELVTGTNAIVVFGVGERQWQQSLLLQVGLREGTQRVSQCRSGESQKIAKQKSQPKQPKQPKEQSVRRPGLIVPRGCEQTT